MSMSSCYFRYGTYIGWGHSVGKSEPICVCMGNSDNLFSGIHLLYGEVLPVRLKNLCLHGETLTIFFQVSYQSSVWGGSVGLF